jgi:hypothetical protein
MLLSTFRLAIILSLRHSRLQSIVWLIVGMRFGFEDPDAKAEWIKATASNLIQEVVYTFPVEVCNTARYSYKSNPMGQNNNVVKTQSYEHPAIIQTLVKFLFNGNSCGPTIGDTYPELFQSRYPEFPDQHEVPLSILALCYDLNEFNSGCNERQRLEGEKGIINKLVKRKEYRSITTLLIRLGLPRVTINGVGLSNYDRGV